jgi:hypothetical protein
MYQNKCIHTKNIFALIDMGNSEENYKLLHQHVIKCEICRNEYNHFVARNTMAKVYIPKPLMEHDLKESFNRELHDFLKELNLNNKNEGRPLLKKILENLDIYGEVIMKIIFSKTMMISYALAYGLYLLLKFKIGVN